MLLFDHLLITVTLLSDSEEQIGCEIVDYGYGLQHGKILKKLTSGSHVLAHAKVVESTDAIHPPLAAHFEKINKIAIELPGKK